MSMEMSSNSDSSMESIQSKYDQDMIEAAHALLLLASSHHRPAKPSPPASPAKRRHGRPPRGVNKRPTNDKKVPIGSGHLTVWESVYKTIDWRDGSKATRKLLLEAFEPNVLATHCLSGKASPAFADRPPKKQLSPNIVDDIVSTVASKCSVHPHIVRGFIRSKCADEAKLSRSRFPGVLVNDKY